MPDYNCFAALQVSTQVEFESLMEAFEWKPLSIERDSQQYYECVFEVEGSSPLRLVAAKADEMGSVAASVLCLKLCAIFHPTFLILTGLAAGVGFTHKQNQPAVGDVVLADRAWDFSSGKYVSPEKASLHLGGIGFQPRPNVLNIQPSLRKILKEIVKSSNLNYRIHIGAISSGTAVVSNKKIVADYVLPIVEKTKGLDMESYGVLYSSLHAIEPRPYTLIVKGICDFADNMKCDDFQKQAADNAFDFLKYLLGEIVLKHQSLYL